MYEVNDEFYLRVPLKPINIKYDENNIFNFCKKYFMENIVINSKSLYESIEKGNGEQKEQRISLIKYLNRASTRTTPYGLNAFVSLGKFIDKNSNLYTFDKNNFQKNLLLDYEWIVKFLMKIEKELGTSLRVTINNSLEINKALVLNKWIDCFHEINEIEKNNVLIKRQKPFNIIYNALQQNFKDIQTLIDLVKNEYHDIDENIIINYIKELLKNGFIISDLRLSSLNERNIDNLINILKMYENQLQIYIEELIKIKYDIDRYNNSKIEQGTDLYIKIIHSLKKICKSENYISVDLYHKKVMYFDKKIKNDVKDFVGFLNKFSNTNYPLYEYYMKFVEKYNYEAVLITEVFDEIKGIGLPFKNKHTVNYINNYLYKLNNNILDLSNINILNSNKNNLLINSHFELSLNIIRKHNNYHYLVTPLIGSDTAYKSLGRFYSIRKDVNNIFENNYDNVELCYFPKKSRIANVLNCYSNSEYYLEYGSYTYLDEKKRLDLTDIYLCPIDGILRFINGRTGNIINFTINNMTNINFAPEIFKGIATVVQCSKKNMFSIYEQIHETFQNSIICPEITYKNFIIKPFELRLKKNSISFKNLFEFQKEIIKLLNHYNLSKKVYCGSEDNYLLLDLSKEINIEILRRQLCSKGYVNIRKTYFDINDLIIREENEKNDKYINEVVFQIINHEEKKDKFKNEFYIGNSNKDWLSIKLYMNEGYMNFFIINYLDEFIKNILEKKEKKDWFYVRYRDPKSHIRVRIHLDGTEDISYLKIREYLYNLEKENVIYYSVLDEYIPETSRYGGVNLMKKIEGLFVESTIISKIIIEKAYQDYELKEKIYYIWTISLLMFINKYCNIEKLLNIYKKYYQRDTKINILRKFLITNYIRDEKNEIFQFVDHMTKNYQEKIKEIVPEIMECNNYNDILLSIIHMNYNRGFGINRKNENELMSNVENIYYSLMCVLKKRDDVR